MECPYCGKRILFGWARRYEGFCSAEHRQKYYQRRRRQATSSEKPGRLGGVRSAITGPELWGERAVLAEAWRPQISTPGIWSLSVPLKAGIQLCQKFRRALPAIATLGSGSGWSKSPSIVWPSLATVSNSAAPGSTWRARPNTNPPRPAGGMALVPTSFDRSTSLRLQQSRHATRTELPETLSLTALLPSTGNPALALGTQRVRLDPSDRPSQPVSRPELLNRKRRVAHSTFPCMLRNGLTPESLDWAALFHLSAYSSASLVRSDGLSFLWPWRTSGHNLTCTWEFGAGLSSCGVIAYSPESLAPVVPGSPEFGPRRTSLSRSQWSPPPGQRGNSRNWFAARGRDVVRAPMPPQGSCAVVISPVTPPRAIPSLPSLPTVYPSVTQKTPSSRKRNLAADIDLTRARKQIRLSRSGAMGAFDLGAAILSRPGFRFLKVEKVPELELSTLTLLEPRLSALQPLRLDTRAVKPADPAGPHAESQAHLRQAVAVPFSLNPAVSLGVVSERHGPGLVFRSHAISYLSPDSMLRRERALPFARGPISFTLAERHLPSVTASVRRAAILSHRKPGAKTRPLPEPAAPDVRSAAFRADTQHFVRLPTGARGTSPLPQGATVATLSPVGWTGTENGIVFPTDSGTAAAAAKRMTVSHPRLSLSQTLYPRVEASRLGLTSAAALGHAAALAFHYGGVASVRLRQWNFLPALPLRDTVTGLSADSVSRAQWLAATLHRPQTGAFPVNRSPVLSRVRSGPSLPAEPAVSLATPARGAALGGASDRVTPFSSHSVASAAFPRQVTSLVPGLQRELKPRIVPDPWTITQFSTPFRQCGWPVYYVEPKLALAQDVRECWALAEPGPDWGTPAETVASNPVAFRGRRSAAFARAESFTLSSPLPHGGRTTGTALAYFMWHSHPAAVDPTPAPCKTALRPPRYLRLKLALAHAVSSNWALAVARPDRGAIEQQIFINHSVPRRIASAAMVWPLDVSLSSPLLNRGTPSGAVLTLGSRPPDPRLSELPSVRFPGRRSPACRELPLVRARPSPDRSALSLGSHSALHPTIAPTLSLTLSAIPNPFRAGPVAHPKPDRFVLFGRHSAPAVPLPDLDLALATFAPARVAPQQSSAQRFSLARIHPVDWLSKPVAPTPSIARHEFRRLRDRIHSELMRPVLPAPTFIAFAKRLRVFAAPERLTLAEELAGFRFSAVRPSLPDSAIADASKVLGQGLLRFPAQFLPPRTIHFADPGFSRIHDSLPLDFRWQRNPSLWDRGGRWKQSIKRSLSHVTLDVAGPSLQEIYNEVRTQENR